MIRTVLAAALVSTLVLAGGCSSRRAAPTAAANAGPTSIAYKPGTGWQWGSGAQPAAATYAQPTYAAPSYPSIAPAAPIAPTAGDFTNVAPYPQAPAAPAFESAPALTPTPGPSVSPEDWSTPSAPPMEAPAAPIPVDGGAGSACGGAGGGCG